MMGQAGMCLFVVNFLSWLQAAFGQGGSLTELVKRKHAANPSSPSNCWKLLMYSDDVVPGNPLGHTQARKVQVVYCAFHEYGAFHLSKEIAWHCIFIKRSNDVLNIDGGMSQVMAGLVKHIFCNPLCNVSQVGLLLKDDQGQHLRLFFELGGFVQDGMAQKSVFSLKGDAGTKYCLLCHNLMAKRSMLSDCLLSGGAFKTDGLVLATDASIRDTLQRLEAKHASLGQAGFKLWQQACGFSYCKHGLVFDDSLKALVKPTSMFIHDWMHCLVACGCFETCMHLCLVAILAVLPTFYETANAWLQSWHLAGSMSTSTLANLFSPKAKASHKTNKNFRCSASQALSLYPLLRVLLHTTVYASNHCQAECKAMFALADFLDLIQAVPHGQVSPSMIDNAAQVFLDACVAAGWEEYMGPKFHWCVHMGSHLQRWGILPCLCFSHHYILYTTILVFCFSHHGYSDCFVSAIIATVIVLFHGYSDCFVSSIMATVVDHGYRS